MTISVQDPLSNFAQQRKSGMDPVKARFDYGLFEETIEECDVDDDISYLAIKWLGKQPEYYNIKVQHGSVIKSGS